MKMNWKAIVLGLVSFAVAGPKVAILDFVALDDDRVANRMAEDATVALSRDLAKESRADIADGREISQAMRKQNFQIQDLQKTSKALQIGADVQANWVIVGDIDNRGKVSLLEVDIYQVNSGKRVNDRMLQIPIQGKLDDVTIQLARNIHDLIRDQIREMREDRRDERREVREDRREDRRDVREDRREMREEKREDAKVATPVVYKGNTKLTFQTSDPMISSLRINGKDNVCRGGSVSLSFDLAPGEYQVELYRDVMPMELVYSVKLPMGNVPNYAMRWVNGKLEADAPVTKSLSSTVLPSSSSSVAKPSSSSTVAPSSSSVASLNNAVPQSPQVCTGKEYLEFINAIKAESFENTKMMILQSTLQNKHFVVEQLGEILELFGFESNKLDAAKLIYPLLVDKERIHTQLTRFGYDSTKRDFLAWIKNQPK